MKRQLPISLAAVLVLLAGAVISYAILADRGDVSSTSVTQAESSAAPTSSAVPSPSSPVIVDAVPATYSFSADRYQFRLAGAPLRECVIWPNADLGGHNVACSVRFPAGTPPVTNPPFSGEPNTIVLRPDGRYNTIGEGGPPGAKLLPEYSRLTVGDAQCTALPGGVDCDNGPAGFRFVDGELMVRGRSAG